ncbi:uncharacterized protein LOC121870629 [Homarus americanus]|uniref:Putative Zona pellucida-like domain-containing protein 3 n=1 Tax=Homarus americanus TaxID=6706 RepID=A0A8J5JVT5_HOMAM|nr:uncharacterized protein LOC121870629 [Homarus americanus]KAG7165392.1 putative Zona pellucida-like domain-containing protein 3 [Homarus americanus]
MVVRVPVDGVRGVELDKWTELPGCGAQRDDSHYTLTLPLDDDLACGTTRVRNKLTGDTLYYHRVAITAAHGRQVVLVKCRAALDNSTMSNIVKRDVLPPEFVEPDYIEITSEVTGTAPIPILGVGVRQDGELVGGQINVRPGTPLTMEVFLDDASAGTYGILMSYMEVTDTENKRETIIFNGCSVDPVLFDNFITTTGDYVSAKFRAFKFPETNYVLFRGTVDVCLDKCQGIACSNGQLGFGRRRRGVDSKPADPNKIFEVTMMTFLKVDEKNNDTNKANFESVAEDMVERIAEDVGAVEQALADAEASRSWSQAVDERDVPYKSSEGNEPVFIYYNNGHSHTQSLILVMAAALLVYFCH